MVAVLAALIAPLTESRLSATGQARDSSTDTVAPPLEAAGESRDSLWRKRWWIEKTARLLRGGEGLGPDDDVEALLQLSEENIARRFMRDIRFGDTILDFNMYFLGFKIDALKSDGIYKRNAFDFTNAITSAQALLKGGDYLKLFDLEGQFFMAPLPLEFDDPLPRDESRLPPETVRLKAVDEVEAIFGRLVRYGATTPAPPLDDYCYEFEKVLEQSTAIPAKLLRAFNDPEVFVINRGRVLTAPIEMLSRAFERECSEEPGATGDVKRLAAAAQEAFNYYYRAVAEILKFEPSRYQPQSVLDFQPFDLSVFKLDKWLAFGFEQSNALKNSSTNFNRKRGAYVLKRFFCDDLTPVGFENPREHVGGTHGSDTTCYACHYKLDPMAGFFRGYGADFYNYSTGSFVVFDDDANSDRRKYESVWAAKAGASRKWNVGYVRSPRYEDHNTYGETLADLSRIIRAAPEPKRCLMRRLFEYAVAENQAVDGGFLDELTRKFEQEAAVNSSEAMKNAIVRVVLSNAYRQPDADPRNCYDFASGAARADAPPCRVAFILEKNCAQCHGGGTERAGRLDLTKWIVPPGGKTPIFPHFDHTGRQMSAQDTLARIVERVSSTDPAIRMPKQRMMPSQDRQALFLWAQDELARLQKGAGR